jgi:hypothetical protein
MQADVVARARDLDVIERVKVDDTNRRAVLAKVCRQVRADARAIGGVHADKVDRDLEVGHMRCAAGLVPRTSISERQAISAVISSQYPLRAGVGHVQYTARRKCLACGHQL